MPFPQVVKAKKFSISMVYFFKTMFIAIEKAFRDSLKGVFILCKYI